MNGGNLVMHHGDYTIDTKLSTAFDDVDKWCIENSDELVMLYLSHFVGDGADSATYAEVDNRKYYTV